MSDLIPLTALRDDGSGIVASCNAEAQMKLRLGEIGVVEGVRVERLYASPLGDPVAYRIFGAVVALRCEDAGSIEVRRV